MPTWKTRVRARKRSTPLRHPRRPRNTSPKGPWSLPLRPCRTALALKPTGVAKSQAEKINLYPNLALQSIPHHRYSIIALIYSLHLTLSSHLIVHYASSHPVLLAHIHSFQLRKSGIFIRIVRLLRSFVALFIILSTHALAEPRSLFAPIYSLPGHRLRGLFLGIYSNQPSPFRPPLSRTSFGRSAACCTNHS